MTLRNLGNMYVFLWIGREKSKGFFSPCAFARPRGGRAKLERKDLRFGLAKRVRRGRIGVEGLHDFRRGLGIACPKSNVLIGRFILTFYFRISPNF